MTVLDDKEETEIPFSKDKVFDALCGAIPSIKGMKVDMKDEILSRIIVKVGVSLFSWGENIVIQLLPISSEITKIQITSSPKTGLMMGGAFDMGKNKKNIEKILFATSKLLSDKKSN